MASDTAPGTIVDAHVHHHWADPDAPPWQHIDATVAAARRSNIDCIVLLGTYSFHGVDPTPDQIRACNTNAAHIVDAYSNGTARRMSSAAIRDTALLSSSGAIKIVSLCYLNPAHDPDFIQEELDRCILQFGMRGIKLWIAVNARDERMAAVIEGAIRHNVPVFFHSWYKTVNWVYNESSPADIRHLALRFPQATIVMLHITGGRERGVLDVKDLPNVYVDTSGSQPDRGLVEFAVKHLGPERVIFGSDAPIRDFPSQLAKITAASLDEASKKQILGSNAATLLKIDVGSQPA